MPGTDLTNRLLSGTAMLASVGMPAEARSEVRPTDAFADPIVTKVDPDLTYRLKPGDTLSKIAELNDTTVKAVADLNGIVDSDKIIAGHLIRLPPPKHSSSVLTAATQPSAADIMFGNFPEDSTNRIGNIREAPPHAHDSPKEALVKVAAADGSIPYICQTYRIDESQFKLLNPEVADRGSIKKGDWLIVGLVEKDAFQPETKPAPAEALPTSEPLGAPSAEVTERALRKGLKIHEVVQGETVSAICKIYDITLARFSELNPDIKDLGRISIGQILVVGKIACDAPPASQPTTQPSAVDDLTELYAPLIAKAQRLPKKEKDPSPKQRNKSHIEDPIAATDGPLRGFNRAYGGASPVVQAQVIQDIIQVLSDKGFNKQQIAVGLAIVQIESGFNPDAAANSTSASGLTQCIDATRRVLADRARVTLSSPFDTHGNIILLAEQLSECLKDAHSLKPQNLQELAAMAYVHHHDGKSKQLTVSTKNGVYQIDYLNDDVQKAARDVLPRILTMTNAALKIVEKQRSATE